MYTWSWVHADSPSHFMFNILKVGQSTSVFLHQLYKLHWQFYSLYIELFQFVGFGGGVFNVSFTWSLFWNFSLQAGKSSLFLSGNTKWWSKSLYYLFQIIRDKILPTKKLFLLCRHILFCYLCVHFLLTLILQGFLANIHTSPYSFVS